MAGLKDYPGSSLAVYIQPGEAKADGKLSGEPVTAKQVFEAARAGDAYAGQIVAAAGELIGLVWQILSVWSTRKS
jgi:predicted NBD/HSP70 family sugar kinase